jgi:hypothetical protein
MEPLNMKAAKSKAISPVRLRTEDTNYIKEVAKEMRETQTSILHRAIELLKRERMFLETRETYFSLSEEEVNKIRNENRLLDQSSADGID